MPKLDLSQIPFGNQCSYPGKLAAPFAGRYTQRLGASSGISQFGVNIVRLDPGTPSSLRHFHMQQDEFVMITEGVCTLIDDTGEHEMQPGDCASFPAGEANGHQLVNNTDTPAAFLVVGTHTESETAIYSDIDMMVRVDPDGYDFSRKDGSPLTADQIGDDT